MKRAILLLFLILLNSAFSTANASVGKGWLGELHIYDEIKQGDYEKVVTFIQKRMGDHPLEMISISIDSPGGDVIEAMKIGRFLRENLIKVRIFVGLSDESNERIKSQGLPFHCYSACVLIMMGSVQRDFQKDSIGIHRTFIQRSFNKDISLDESQKLQKELSKLVETYISEMGGSIAFFEKMMSVDSSDLQMLSREEFDSLIGTNDPATHEWLYSKCTNELLSSEESAYLDVFRIWEKFYYAGNDEMTNFWVNGTIMKLNPQVLEMALLTKHRVEGCEDCELVNARNRRTGIAELRPEPCFEWRR